MTEQQSETSENQLEEQENFLDQEFQALIQELKDSGLTVQDTGPQIPMNKLEATFHSQRPIKQTKQQTE